MAIPKKIRLAMEDYINKNLLPVAYEHACSLGYDLPYEDYLSLILDTLKGKKEDECAGNNY